MLLIEPRVFGDKRGYFFETYQKDTYGRWIGEILSAENHRQLWIPEGFAHGFMVTGDHALFNYKVTGAYRPDVEHTLLWNDPAVGIEWPLGDAIVSPKDAVGHRLGERA